MADRIESHKLQWDKIKCTEIRRGQQAGGREEEPERGLLIVVRPSKTIGMLCSRFPLPTEVTDEVHLSEH